MNPPNEGTTVENVRLDLVELLCQQLNERADTVRALTEALWAYRRAHSLNCRCDGCRLARRALRKE